MTSGCFSKRCLQFIVVLPLQKNNEQIFSDAQPTEGEKETFQQVNEVLQNSHQILDDLQCYKGAGKEIREAIASPNEETQSIAWTAVVPLVSKLKTFYQFSTQLGKHKLKA